jgi:hypothetical protein
MSEIMGFEIRDGEWANNLQNGLEGYMMGLYESVDAPFDSEESDVETESGIPFCGCNVCESREIISYLTPRIIKGYIDEKVGFTEVEDGFIGKAVKVPKALTHE